ITIDGHPYPTAPRTDPDRLVITRQSALAALNGETEGAPISNNGAAQGVGREGETHDQVQVPISSGYEGNQLENGESPYDEFFGRGVYNNEMNLISFSNGQGADAVVLLVEGSTGQTIR